MAALLLDHLGPGRSPRRLVATLALAASIGIGIGSGAASAAADVTFEQPSASGGFAEPVVFTTSFRSAETPLRVELLRSIPGERAQRVGIAETRPNGPGSWLASFALGGHIIPNTNYEYRFRVVTPDGPVLGPGASHRVQDGRVEWQVLEGDRVNVWWHRGDESFAERALAIAERAVDDAAQLLGVKDIDPVDFIIYGDSRTFRDAMGPATRENVGGQAHPDIRTLFGLIEPRQIGSDWVEELVVHELSHLVFDEAVRNPYSYPPRWLNEGLAVYLSKGYEDGDRAQVEGAARSGSIIPLDGLGGHFPTRPSRFGLAYAESVAAVDHFVETYGEDRLVKLITSFQDGIGLDDAFINATGADFGAFDDAWLASLGADRPQPLGP